MSRHCASVAASSTLEACPDVQKVLMQAPDVVAVGCGSKSAGGAERVLRIACDAAGLPAALVLAPDAVAMATLAGVHGTGRIKLM